MQTMKPVFHLTLILYLCAFLTGVPFVLSASAKITPKKVDADTSFYEIRKGDTLWDLARKYRGQGILWKEFRNYNSFTNPNLIYPREQLQVLSAWGFPGTQMKPVTAKEPPRPPMADTRFDELKASLEKTSGAVNNLASQIDGLHKQHQTLQGDISEIQKATKANAQGIEQLNNALMSQSEASKMELTKIHGQIDELAEKTDKLQRNQTDEFEMLTSKVRSVTEQMEKMHGGMMEQPKPVAPPHKAFSGKKGVVTFLVALAGGATWFVVNAIDNSSE